MGKKYFSKTKKKIGEKNVGMLGKHHTERARRKIGEARRGKKYSKEYREKISDALRGRRHSEEHKRKLSLAMRGKNKGNKHWNWKGGKSSELYPTDWTDDLKESIRKRDNYICQMCGVHQDELFPKFDVHYIDYYKNNLDPDNLISLCKSCHTKTNFNRNYWIDYFNSLLREV